MLLVYCAIEGIECVKQGNCPMWGLELAAASIIPSYGPTIVSIELTLNTPALGECGGLLMFSLLMRNQTMQLCLWRQWSRASLRWGTEIKQYDKFDYCFAITKQSPSQVPARAFLWKGKKLCIRSTHLWSMVPHSSCTLRYCKRQSNEPSNLYEVESDGGVWVKLVTLHTSLYLRC